MIQINQKISDADKKIPDTSDLAKKTDLNAKITEIESKIPGITGLATNSALTAVENKIPDVSSFVKKIMIMIQKYQILKKRLLIMFMINTSLLQNLIN